MPEERHDVEPKSQNATPEDTPQQEQKWRSIDWIAGGTFIAEVLWGSWWLITQVCRLIPWNPRVSTEHFAQFYCGVGLGILSVGYLTLILWPIVFNTFKQGKDSKQDNDPRWFHARILSSGIVGGSYAFLLPAVMSLPEGGVNSGGAAALRQAILLATGGLIALIALGETRRKNDNDKHKNDQEKEKNDRDHLRQVRAERRERYTKAIEQLGNEKASIRTGGVYTLTRLVDDWLEEESLSKVERLKEGQVIINNLCAYIRSPFTLASYYDELSKDAPKANGIYKDRKQDFYTDKAIFDSEADTRLSIIKEIHDRLQISEENPWDSWSNFEYNFSGSTFFYPINLTKSYYKKPVNFSGSTYQDLADFGGSTYQDLADFSRSTYEQNVTFSTSGSPSTYQDLADFSRSTYRGEASFGSSIYKGAASFSGSMYQEEAEFGSSTYQDEADFNSSTYHEWADFSGSTYQGRADFSVSTYWSQANFSHSTYQGRADLSGSIYHEWADFSVSTYQGRADFSDSTYKGEANFSVSTYEKDVIFSTSDFSGSTYQSKANFSHSTYHEWADFSVSTYQSKANFSHSTYRGRADFSGSTYQGQADFSVSTYEKDVIFSTSNFNPTRTYEKGLLFSISKFRSIYQSEADFLYSIYHGQSDFSGSTYQSRADCSGSIFCSDIYFGTDGDNGSFSRFTDYAPQFYDETNRKNTLFGSPNNDFTAENGRGYPIYRGPEGLPLGCKFLTSDQKEHLADNFQEIEKINNELLEIKDDKEKARLSDTLRSLYKELHKWREEVTTVKVKDGANENMES